MCCVSRVYTGCICHWNNDTAGTGKVLNIAYGVYMICDHMLSPFDIAMNKKMRINLTNILYCHMYMFRRNVWPSSGDIYKGCITKIFEPIYKCKIVGYKVYGLIYKGCGRKNTPIWEGHSFGWGARTVVGSASSNSGVRAVFSVHYGVVGRTSNLYC